MTPKQRVLAVFPTAEAFRWADGYVIFDRVPLSTAISDSRYKRAARAWADAAARLGKHHNNCFCVQCGAEANAAPQKGLDHE